MGLKHIFGDKPIPRVLDFLSVHRDWDYSLSEIREATDVSYRTLQAVVPRLVKEGLLVETREVSRAKMYAINKKSPVVRKLDELALAADYEAGRREAQAARESKLAVATNRA